jgi:hypothetical protein
MCDVGSLYLPDLPFTPPPCCPLPLNSITPSPLKHQQVASFQDGRQVMAFATSGCCAAFPDCPAAQAQTCMVLSHLALSWAFRGIVPGLRRSLVSTQVCGFVLC